MSERLLHHGASFQPNHRHPTPPRPYGYIPSHRLPHPPRLLFLPPYFPPTPTRQVVSLLLTPRYSTSTNPSRLFPYSSLHPRHTQDPERGGYEPESRLPRPRKPQLVQDCTQRFSIQPDTLTEDRSLHDRNGDSLRLVARNYVESFFGESEHGTRTFNA